VPDAETRRIRAGDHETFNRLFDLYAPRVLGYLLRMSVPRAEAEDLTQESFVSAYEARAGYRGDAQPLAWLLGIARRRWRDRQRGPVRELVVLDDRALESHPVPARVAEGVIEAAVLDDALRRLPAAEREVLLLTAVEGLTYAEAAQVLGEPAGTLKWRVHEAMGKLRLWLAVEGEDDGAKEQRAAGGAGGGGTGPARRAAPAQADCARPAARP
jgi:RNA polymerase sigma-70 factor, ECF subfamily